MTGKEAARINENSEGGREQMLAFLRTASARELQDYIHHISVDSYSHKYQLARTALDVRIAEDALKAAEIVERQTNKLIFLTWVLLVLTAVLAAIGTVQIVIMVKQNPDAHPHSIQTGEHKQDIQPQQTDP